MYTPFKDITKGKSLWNFHGGNCDILNEDGEYFRMEQNGLEYTCFIEEQDGISVRRDRITNISDKAITFQPNNVKFDFPGGDYQVYTQYNAQLTESSGMWQPLVTEVRACCTSFRTSRGAAPFMVLWSDHANRGVVFHILADSTWQITASRYASGGGGQHAVEVQVNFYDNKVVTLQPGESIKMPTVLFYNCRNKLDMDAWKLHRWCNTYHPRQEYPVTYNTWLYRFDHFTPENILSQVPVAAELGFEYFVVDAGWFGTKGIWFKTVGDWEETPDSAMAGRLKDVSDAVRANGMKFGLWFEIERATYESKAYQEHPEFYAPGLAYPMFNFAKPEVRQHVLNLIDEKIKEYNIGYIKFDLNAELTTIEGDEALTKYFEGYRAFLVALKMMHPDVYIECCASGGMRFDLNNIFYFGSFWLTDNQSPYHTVRIFKDSIRRLPPQVIELWSTITSLKEFRPAYKEPYVADKILATHDSTWSSLISVKPSWLEGIMLGGPIGFSCDLTSFTDELKEQVKRTIQEVKEDRDYWMHTETRILCDAKDQLVLEHTDKDFNKINLMVYTDMRRHLTIPVFPVVDVNATYTDGENTYTGKELDENGLILQCKGTMAMNRVVLKKI